MAAAPMNMLQLAQAVCATQTAKLRAALQRLLRHPDADAVHDVRVACRRLRVALRTPRKLFGTALVETLRGPLKELLALLGATRDMEALSARVKLLADKGDQGARELLQALELQMEKQRRAAEEVIERNRFVFLPDEVESFVYRPRTDSRSAVKSQAVPAAQCAARVLTRHFRLLQQYAKLDGQSPAEKLHALRLEMKKLRYAGEFFAHGLGHEAPAGGRQTPQPLRVLIKTTQWYQELLGELHDAVMAEETLIKWLRTGLPWAAPGERGAKEAPPAGTLQALVASAHADQVRLRRKFGEKWSTKPLRKLRLAIKAIK